MGQADARASRRECMRMQPHMQVISIKYVYVCSICARAMRMAAAASTQRVRAHIAIFDIRWPGRALLAA